LYLLQYKVQYRVLIDVSRFDPVTQQQNGFSQNRNPYINWYGGYPPYQFSRGKWLFFLTFKMHIFLYIHCYSLWYNAMGRD